MEGLDGLAGFPGDENRQSLEQRFEHLCVMKHELINSTLLFLNNYIKNKLKAMHGKN